MVSNFVNLVGNEPGMTDVKETLIAEFLERVPEQTFHDLLRGALSRDLRPLLPRVDVPALVIAAEHDAVQPSSLRELAQGIRGADFALIRGTSHFAPFTATEVFAEIVRTWLRDGSLAREEWVPGETHNPEP